MKKAREDRLKAKAILLEAVRAAGGRLENLTNLYRAFYFAHLVCMLDHGRYLSIWPIVKMGRGPGVHEGKQLTEELEEGGLLENRPRRWATCTGREFLLVDRRAAEKFIREHLTTEERECVRRAVKFLKNRTASEVSELSHLVSRSWRSEKKMGAELDIYADLILEDEEADALSEKVDAEMEAVRKVFGT